MKLHIYKNIKNKKYRIGKEIDVYAMIWSNRRVFQIEFESEKVKIVG